MMDVKSLYTVIPHRDGLEALKFFLNKRTLLEPSTTTLIRLAELVLTINDFSFDGEYYQQISGVAMGTKMGPSYANLFVGYVEQQIFERYTGPIPDFFGRYIDDCLGTASCTRVDLERFINYVNGFHHALKFTWEISETCVSFLDISVSINGDALATSVSYKPTDSHSYLLFSSSHPNHTKQSIPYSQFLRLRRLCSEDKDFETKSLEMRTFFVERGYPTYLLDSAIQKAFNNSRRDTLKPPLAKISDDKIPLVLTFHPFNYKVRDVISRNFLILKNDPETSTIFTDNPLISFRRNKNMRDNLVRSALRQNLPAPAGTFSCSRARCYTCSFLNSATSISGPKSNFVIRHNFTCTSSNIIYCISCSKCCKLYIGETGRRLSEHLRSVRNNDVDKPVARHFNAANHSISDMKICAISPISGGNDSRKRHEKRLIFKIGTIHPHGLNERFSFI